MSSQQILIAERAVKVEGVKVGVAMSDSPHDHAARLPLLLLPAAGFVWQDYRSVIEALAPVRQVIALDWPGFGASDRPAPTAFHFSADHLAGLVGQVTDALGIARAGVLGNGMGAAVGIFLAHERPMRVAGLCLMGPAGFGKPTLGGELMGSALGSAGIMRLAMPTLLDLVLGPTTHETQAIMSRVRACQKQDGYAAMSAAMSALWKAQAGLSADALAERARQIVAPALVVRGELDPIVTQAASRRATEAMGTGSALEVILPDAGHLPFLQEPKRFLAALDGLLRTAELHAAGMS